MRPASEDTVTIRPQPRAHIPSTVAFVQCSTPYRLRRTNRSQSATGMSRKARSVNPSAGIPALFTRTSTGPSVVSTSRTMAATAAPSVTSATHAAAWAPAAVSVAATVSARPRSRSFTATAAPAAARPRATPAPTPRPAPVTRATRPVRCDSAATIVILVPRRRSPALAQGGLSPPCSSVRVARAAGPSVGGSGKLPSGCRRKAEGAQSAELTHYPKPATTAARTAGVTG